MSFLLNLFKPRTDPLVLSKLETIMLDLANLKAVADRLQASSTAELALLQSVKDQNTALAAQLASLQAGDPAAQATIDAIAKELGDSADAIDAAVKANPATPNLTPSTPVPAPAADV